MISSCKGFLACSGFMWLAILNLSQSVSAFPSKTEMLKKMAGNKFPVSVPYSASVATKIFVGNQAIKDSGTVFSQPPDCMQMQMSRACAIIVDRQGRQGHS